MHIRSYAQDLQDSARFVDAVATIRGLRITAPLIPDPAEELKRNAEAEAEVKAAAATLL